MIENPTPIKPTTFDGMWITQLNILIDKDGIVNARLLPFDGSTNLLANGGKNTPNGAKLPKLVLDSLIEETKRQAKTTTNPKMIQVFAQDPTKPVFVQIIFEETTPKTPPYRIMDCYALAGSDAKFAKVFGTVMASIAQLAGLAVV